MEEGIIMNRLEGKVAIVTGAAKGMGEATAKLFAQHGAKVVITDIDQEFLYKVEAEIREQDGEVLAIVQDTADKEKWEEVVKQTVEHFGKITTLINNAGLRGNVCNVLEESVEGYDDIMNVDARGIFYGMKYVAPEMIKAGGGSIVNTASINGTHFASASFFAYAAAKSSVIGMTRSAAGALGKHNIRVNAISPGFILTPLTEGRPQEIKDKFADRTCLKRNGQACEVAYGHLFLASDESSFMTGQQLYIDGGVTVTDPF